MSINPLNNHYSMTNPASVYDEEAMTALELAGRTAAKVNEAVNAFNDLEDRTEAKLDGIPDVVDKAVEDHINDGEFDESINAYMGDLEDRIENLENSYQPGSTTDDAALYDIQLDVNGRVHATPGNAVRANQKKTRGVIDKGDLNEYRNEAMIHVCVAGGLTNAPSTASGILDVDIITTILTDPAPWVIQRWYDTTGTNAGQSYYRYYYNGTWSAWRMLGSRFDKLAFEFVSGNADEHTKNCYGIALNTATNVPAAETALFECQTFSSTGAAGTMWVRQTWTGIDSGLVYERIMKPTGVWTPWRSLTTAGGNTSHVLAGKNVVFLGDSIFAQNQTATGVVNLFAEMTGAKCHNFAFGGTRLSPHGEIFFDPDITPDMGDFAEWAMFDGQFLVQAIISGDFSFQEAAIATATDFPSYFANTLLKLKSFDFTTADYIVINWGTNDYDSTFEPPEYPLLLQHIIDLLATAFPNAVIIKVTPTRRFKMVGGVVVDPGANVGDYTLDEYVESDRTTALESNIQLVDAFNIGINEHNALGFFDANDLVHHNARGRERLARFLAGSIM